MTSTTLPMGARGLKRHLEKKLKPAIPTDRELGISFGIGHPAAPSFAPDASGTKPNFSIFFYKVVPAKNSGSDHPQRPLDTVAHCLLTPLARTGDEDDAWSSAGERDLDMLGRVMQVLHSEPRFQVVDADESFGCEVEAIPLELTLEELNKIVPAPPEGGFRPSAAYLISLLPLDPIETESDAPPVRITSYTLTHLRETSLQTVDEEHES